MKLTTLLLTLILIGGFTTGLINFIGALSATYLAGNVTVIENFSKITNVANRNSAVWNDTQAMYNTVNESQSGKSASSGILSIAPVNLLFGAYNAAMLVLSTPIYFINIFNVLLYSVPGMPGWVGDMVWAIISIIVLGIIIGFITGRFT